MSAWSGESVDRLRLARTPRVGPVTYAQLVSRFGSAGAAVAALPDLAQRAGGKPPRPANREDAERELAAVAALGGRHIFSDDADYPPMLLTVEAPPPVLMVNGNAALLQQRSVAIVGARNASAAACRFARQIAAELGEAGVTVVSGLARGIDAAAHHGAMNHATAAVIASGLDVYFPPENRALQDQIAEQHLLITEYQPGTEPLARQFPHRNRIIAWATLGTVVVEAAPKSGSLLTARLATEAGREVMAVPGSPLDARAQGCNALIREGATLVQSVDDILEALGVIDDRATVSPAMRAQQRQAALPLDIHPKSAGTIEPDDASRTALTALLGPIAVTVDELVRQSGMEPGAIQSVLIDLEVAGKLDRHAGGRVALRVEGT